MEIEKLANRLKNRTPVILGSERFSKFAILLPLVEIEGEIHVLFEVRSHQMRRQPGEVCFPGGRIDSGDRDEKHTAIRETSEELGISEDSIINISPLDYMISFGQIIYPYAGIIKTPNEIVPNPAEVEEVFTIPLSFLKEVKPETYHINFKVEPEENFPFDLIVGGENYNWQTRKAEEIFYFFKDKVIWGLTARILKHFLEIV
ncbi:NUDIX hydrolase [Cytobacillus sp. NCCP-133]|uniref:NUDIX hydrolase n=1 Tax=Cytobacillus sp. NCCP-133 TaxID=766848 RepID=UPI00222F6E85|nr:CoA pyrophosphatase [Cytobacillus sp. NCCP-133]GLB58697.1 coenzyme A pyrophosphatase [Cytobacillus sp. NCCP-133]